MSEIASTNEHDAINRLFDLARDGQTGNTEFAQLGSMVYDRLIQSYDGGEVAPLGNAQVYGIRAGCLTPTSALITPS